MSLLRKALTTCEDDYLASCLALTMTKLSVKAKRNLSAKFNQMAVDSILVICAMLNNPNPKSRKRDPDSKQRMQICLKLLSNPKQLQKLSTIEKLLSI